MTKCNWELACTLFLALDCFPQWTASHFPVRNPSSATRRYNNYHWNHAMVPNNHQRSPKSLFFQHLQMFFLMLGLTFFIKLGVLGDETRLWEFEPGKCLTSTVGISRRNGIGIHDAAPEAIRTHANYHRVSIDHFTMENGNQQIDSFSTSREFQSKLG